MPCPLMAGIALFEELLDKYEHLYEDAEAARGRLMLTRELAEPVHSALPCIPQLDDQRKLVCSLGHVLGDVQAYALGLGKQAHWAVPLDEIAGKANAARVGAKL
jgi:hypothetical protein